MTRRNFIGSTAAMTALAYAQVPASNDRLRIGVIGCGGQSNDHMRTLVKMRESDNCEIIAVCDVFDKRADEASKLTGGKVVKDYRHILDNKDVDYVLIATPEHWHYQMIIDAANAGKHIYTEKPMTQTAAQAKKVAEKINASKLKMQVGVQGMSDDSYETAQKFVKDGALGKVVLAQIDYSRNYQDDFWEYPVDADAKPGVNLDWKAWLGAAPKRPFDPDRYFSWRRYWDYSSGIASDLFIHRVTRIIKSLDLGFPEFGVGSGGKFEFTKSAAEIPDTFNVLLDYPGGPTVQLISSMANGTSVPHLIRGHKATLEFTRTGFTIRPDGENGGQEIVHQKTGAEALDLHHRNLQNAIRHGEALKCDVNLGYRGVVACEMGVQSYRKRRTMRWDAAKQRIV
ncbi:MAG TPA: Gfo/Idh/MocA family oxidoreductase [Bryobacteraceae bacterium]|nr:Gfo/Idh/MocA family oxidoreductase [Bryobacteraceae bacterium]